MNGLTTSLVYIRTDVLPSPGENPCCEGLYSSCVARVFHFVPCSCSVAYCVPTVHRPCSAVVHISCTLSLKPFV